MPSQSLKSSCKGAFQPIDRLSEPLTNDHRNNQTRQKSAPAASLLNHATSRPGISKLDWSWNDKTTSYRSGGGPFLRRPSLKRQKINDQDIQYNREKGPKHDNSDEDIGYDNSPRVEHVSSLSAKRASRSSDDLVVTEVVQTFRTVEGMMQPSSSHPGIRPTSKALKSQDHLGKVWGSDDFEMAYMPHGSTQTNRVDNELHYDDKPVMVKGNGDSGVSKGSNGVPHILFSHRSASNVVKSNSGSLTEGEGERLPDPSQPSSTDDKVALTQTESCINRHDSTGAPSRSPRNLRDKFRRDAISVEMDQEIDSADELQQSPPQQAAMAILGRTSHTATSKIDDRPTLKKKQHGDQPSDEFALHEKRSNSHTKPLPVMLVKQKQKHLKSQNRSPASQDSYPLEAFFVNPRLFKAPLKIYLEPPFFKVVDGDSETTTISLESFSEVKMCKKDDGLYVCLKGHREGNLQRIVYLVFEEDEHLNWFRDKLILFTGGGPKAKVGIKFESERWLKRAFNRQVELSADLNFGETRGSVLSSKILSLSRRNGQEISYEKRDTLLSSIRPATRSQGGRNGLKRDGFRMPIESSPQISRFRPYTDAIAQNNGWKTPIRYPPGADRQGVAIVEPQEIENLEPKAFLNDSLILFGLRYMLETHPELKGRVHLFNTYFYHTLTRKGKGKGIDYEAVQRWTTKQNVDIFDKDYIIVPINQDVHWFLAIICNPNKIELRPVQDTEAVAAKQSAVSSRTPSEEPSAKLGTHPYTSHDREQTPETAEKTMVIDVAQMSLDGKEMSECGAESKDGPRPQEIRDSFESNKSDADEQIPPSQATKPPSAKDNNTHGSQTAQVENSKVPAIFTLDSMGDAHYDVVRSLKDYLIQEALHKHKANIDVPAGKSAKEIPQQPNFYDCGLYVIEYTKRFLDDTDTFIEKVATGKMDLSYWPNTVAADLRDDFREVVFQEACKQNGIAPSIPPAHLRNDDALPTSSSNGQMRTPNPSDSDEEQKSVSRSGAEQGSKPTKRAPSRGLFERNEFEVRIDKTPEQDTDRQTRHQFEISSNPERPCTRGKKQ